MSKQSDRKRGEIVLHEECIAGQNCGPIFGHVRIAIPFIEEFKSKMAGEIKNIIQGKRRQNKHSFGKGNR